MTGTTDQSTSGASLTTSPPTVGVRQKMLDDTSRFVGDRYQLGAEIGRGGFGVVHSALDLRNGRSVAIKQVSLHNIGKEGLVSIESEISLLRKLNHENIVKYFDTIKTPQSLYIVLEYMENGSLAQFLKKFGALSETLVAMYITQVLRGLAYLHEQGVIHRDIKGANILTTKDGLVKLADFGVAMKLSDAPESDSFVGSPYWMAPEVIELAGWSFASDIWGVGCTIIELVTTKPPYFDLQPMQAFFRIVSDDHPPLPERISPALHDFIMKCFMKESRLRSTAEELLNHPWIAQIPKNKVEQSTLLVEEKVTSSLARDAMLNTIKLYEKEQQPSPIPSFNSENMVEEEDDEDWDEEFELDSTPHPITLSSTKPAVTKRAQKTEEKSAFKLSEEDASALLDEQVWGEKDEENMDMLHHDDRTDSLRRHTPSNGNNFDTSSSSSWGKSALMPMEQRLLKLRNFRENDDSADFSLDDLDENKLQMAVTRKKSPEDGTTQDKLAAFQTEEDGEGDSEEHDVSGDFDLESSEAPLVIRHMSSLPNGDDTSFEENLFEDELDFDYSNGSDLDQQTMARAVTLLTCLDPSMDDEVILDACADLEQVLASSVSFSRDLMSQPGVVPNIMEALEMKRMDVLHAVLKVVNRIVQDNKKFQENLALVGLLPVILKLTQQHNLISGPSMLAAPSDTESLGQDFSSLVRLEAGKFVRQSCHTSSLTLQMFIACGGLPVLVDFLRPNAHAPSQEYTVELIRIGLEGIFSVFRLQTIPKNDLCRLFVKAGLLKNFVVVFSEIVRSLALDVGDKEESLRDSTIGSHSQNVDVSKWFAATVRSASWSVKELNQMCDVLLKFSQGDAVVKEHMCDGAVLEGLLDALHPRSWSEHPPSPSELAARQSNGFDEATVTLLRCVRNLSMEPQTLDKLDRAGTIPVLVNVLTEQQTRPTSHGKEIENLVLLTMFYLCRINRARQTHAAQAGVVPLIMKVINEGTPLKQFAVPILCDLAQASPTARSYLWSNKGLQLLLELLQDKYWQVDAAKSVSVWLGHETLKVENVLLEPRHLMSLIRSFQVAQDTDIENLLEPILEMATRSVRLNQSLGRSALFVREIMNKLRRIPKAIVRTSLLKMLKSLFESHTAPTQFLVEFDIYPTVKALAQDENNMILVKEIASQMQQAILVSAAVF